jgi:hypothetical protein
MIVLLCKCPCPVFKPLEKYLLALNDFKSEKGFKILYSLHTWGASTTDVIFDDVKLLG